MLHVGEGDPVLGERLERAYYALTATTRRHFGKLGEGWFLTGVAGLDAPTMNRAVVAHATPLDVQRLLDEARVFFGERECQWSVTLSSFRQSREWHGELIARGLHPTSVLDVLVRDIDSPPVPMPAHVNVREAKQDESAAFTEIIMDVFRMPRRFYPALLDMTEAWREVGHARLYFAEQEGERVATALLAPSVEGVAGVYNVGTLRHARGAGIARGLMSRLLADARDTGAELVTLQVAPEGFVEPFYLRLGFEPLYKWRFYSMR